MFARGFAQEVFEGCPEGSVYQEPDLCCITRTAFAKGNWARSSSL